MREDVPPHIYDHDPDDVMEPPMDLIERMQAELDGPVDEDLWEELILAMEREWEEAGGGRETPPPTPRRDRLRVVRVEGGVIWLG